MKVGLFRKETRYKKEQKTETYTESTTLKFNGWLIDPFYRYGYGRLDWKYCLGSDGELYVISSYTDNDGKMQYKVDQVAPMFPTRVRIPHDNMLVAVSHGWMGALDSVAADMNAHPSVLKEEYDYNFPLHLTNVMEYAYPDGFGTLARLARLIGLPERAFIQVDPAE